MARARDHRYMVVASPLRGMHAVCMGYFINLCLYAAKVPLTDHRHSVLGTALLALATTGFDHRSPLQC